MQNLSVVAVPFNNWTIALDFKYKCRMASGTYTVANTNGTDDNQLSTAVCAATRPATTRIRTRAQW